MFFLKSLLEIEQVVLDFIIISIQKELCEKTGFKKTI